MRKLRLSICFQTLILMLLSFNICYGIERTEKGESPKTWDEIRWKVSNISLKTAQKISQVNSLVEKYKDPNNIEKDKTLNQLVNMYQENVEKFLSIVILDKLESISKLNVLPEENNRFIKFRKIIQKDQNTVLNYIADINDPGFKHFFSSWHAKQKDYNDLPQNLKSLRISQIKKDRKEMRSSLKDVGGNTRVDVLFSKIVNWKKPLEYEVSTLLILEEYNKTPRIISEKIRQLLIENVPSEVPPPYTNSHTVFQELCFLAICTNDQDLIETFSVLSSSNNKYVAYKSLEVIKWLQQKVEYPIEYEQLYRAYESQS